MYGILQQVAQKYMELAPQFAEIIKEYIVLENIYHGNDFAYCPKIGYRDLQSIPDINTSDKYLFQNKPYEVCRDNFERIRKKYDIPNYNVVRIKM